MRSLLTLCLLSAAVASASADIFHDVKSMDTEAVRAYVEGGGDANVRNKDGWAPLHVAALVGHGPTAALLLGHGANVNARGGQGGTPFRVAVVANQLFMAGYLVNQGADPNLPDDFKRTVLDVAGAMALSKGHRTSHCAAYESVRSLGGRATTLHAPAACDDREALHSLLAARADPNARDLQGRTPLHILALPGGSYGRPGPVGDLLEAGADPSALDREGRTPLQVAAATGGWLEHLLTDLVPHGADVRVRDAQGRELVDIVIQSRHPVRWGYGFGPEPDAVEFLVQHGGTPRTLAAAAALGRADTVRGLLAAGSDPNAPTDRGWTALHYAVARPDVPVTVAQALIEAGADTDARGPEGETPLHLAADRPELMRLLLEHGADPSARSDRGSTPLHQAAAAPEATLLLLDHGADPNAQDDSGRTPLHDACQSLRVIDILLQHGADINAVDYRGNSIVGANWCGCKPDEVVPALLERGLNPNLALPVVEEEPVREHAELLLKADARPEGVGARVLQSATAAGDADLARWALGLGPDLHNRELTTRVLRHAAAYGHSLPVLQLLAEAGMDLDAAEVDGETGMTPLQYAVWMYPVGTVAGTSPGTLIEAGVTPDIFSAAGWNQLDRLQALIEGGADPNVRHVTDGRTPLHWAARLDACDAAEFLLQSGSSPNVQDKDGRLPFHAAYETRWSQPSSRMLEMLLEAGTDLTLRDKNGTNVLGCLARSGGLSRPSLGWRLFEQGATM